MSKPHTFPILFNEVLQIHISKLKKWGYLEPRQIRSGSIKWSRDGEQIASISIRVDTYSNPSNIELDYKTNGEPRNYKVYLTSTPSNLNKGKVWYFLCPQINKRCRKLYLVNGWFLHREAFRGCMYESQTHSKYSRLLDKALGTYFNVDRHYEQLHKKYFKKSYAGKPTKKYLRITEQIKKAESIPYANIEKLIIM